MRSVSITLFTYSNLSPFFVCNFGNIGCTNKFDLSNSMGDSGLFEYNSFNFFYLNHFTTSLLENLFIKKNYFSIVSCFLTFLTLPAHNKTDSCILECFYGRQCLTPSLPRETDFFLGKNRSFV